MAHHQSDGQEPDPARDPGSPSGHNGDTQSPDGCSTNHDQQPDRDRKRQHEEEEVSRKAHKVERDSNIEGEDRNTKKKDSDTERKDSKEIEGGDKNEANSNGESKTGDSKNGERNGENKGEIRNGGVNGGSIDEHAMEIDKERSESAPTEDVEKSGKSDEKAEQSSEKSDEKTDEQVGQSTEKTDVDTEKTNEKTTEQPTESIQQSEQSTEKTDEKTTEQPAQSAQQSESTTENDPIENSEPIKNSESTINSESIKNSEPTIESINSKSTIESTNSKSTISTNSKSTIESTNSKSTIESTESKSTIESTDSKSSIPNTSTSGTQSTDTGMPETEPPKSSSLRYSDDSLYIEPGNVNCWLFSEDFFLQKSPCRNSLKMSVPQELKVREGIHDFIVRLGSRLKLDGRTILAASIYVNRYYMRMPISSSKYYVASAAVAISTKINDTYRQPDKIALQACNLKNPNPKNPIDEQSEMFWRWRDQLLYREELILKTLSFDLNIELPYSIREDIVGMDVTDNTFFQDKKEEILKNTVSLIEIVSSLPVLMAYDMYTLFGTMLVVVMLEGKEKFNKDISLPKRFLQEALRVDAHRCYRCYSYMMELLKYAAQDPLSVSNKAASKRFSVVDKDVFIAMANGD